MQQSSIDIVTECKVTCILSLFFSAEVHALMVSNAVTEPNRASAVPLDRGKIVERPWKTPIQMMMMVGTPCQILLRK
jgi:hypothetical protein